MQEQIQEVMTKDELPASRSEVSNVIFFGHFPNSNRIRWQ